MTPRKKTIQPDDDLKEVFRHSRAKSVFKKHRMGCLKYGGFAQEKLRHAAYCHGLDVEALILEICPKD